MSVETLLDYTIVAAVIGGCAFLLVRFVRQTFTGGTKGCGCCPDGKDCTENKEASPKGL